jgi:hypothetical protein
MSPDVHVELCIFHHASCWDLWKDFGKVLSYGPGAPVPSITPPGCHPGPRLRGQQPARLDVRCPGPPAEETSMRTHHHVGKTTRLRRAHQTGTVARLAGIPGGLLKGSITPEGRASGGLAVFDVYVESRWYRNP